MAPSRGPAGLFWGREPKVRTSWMPMRSAGWQPHPPPPPPRKRLLCAKLTTCFSSPPGLPEQDFSGALVGPVVGTAALSALVLMFLCKR